MIGRLAELADAGLLVVLVDDLHWADLAIAARIMPVNRPIDARLVLI